MKALLFTIISSKRFGIPFCISLALLIWLFTIENKYCLSVSDHTLQYVPDKCWFESLLISIMNGRWPYDESHQPEYYNLFLFMGIFFTIWFVMSYYAKRKFEATTRQN